MKQYSGTGIWFYINFERLWTLHQRRFRFHVVNYSLIMIANYSINIELIRKKHSSIITPFYKYEYIFTNQSKTEQSYDF